MKERAAMIKVAVNNGITSLEEIRNRYDEEGDYVTNDNTFIEKPNLEITSIKRPYSHLIASGYRRQQTPNGEILLPPLARGNAVPVYPEFELLLGSYGLLGDAKDLYNLSKIGIKKITRKNAHKITDAQWDKAYEKAIKNNDLEEAQRLRDLHFKAKAPNTKVVDSNGNPVKTYHGNMTGDSHYRSQRLNPYSTTRSSGSSSGYFSSSSEKIADSYHLTPDAKTHQVYLNYEDPLIIDAQGAHYSTIGTDRVANKAFSQGKDGVIIKNVEDAGMGRISGPVVGEDRIADDFISTAGRAKSSDAVTKRVDIFTGEDEIIPLSERDNFLNPDIRYSWLLPIGLTTTFGFPYLVN
jgi:hypothetical protein